MHSGECKLIPHGGHTACPLCLLCVPHPWQASKSSGCVHWWLPALQQLLTRYLYGPHHQITESRLKHNSVELVQ